MTKVILFFMCSFPFTHYPPACDEQRIQQLVHNTAFVVLAEVVEVKPAPSFWSGQFAAIQYVRYKVIRSLKGNLTDREIYVGHYVVRNSLTADKDHPSLSPRVFKISNHLILFLEVDQQHTEKAEAESKRESFLSPDENCGAMLANHETIQMVTRVLSLQK